MDYDPSYSPQSTWVHTCAPLCLAYLFTYTFCLCWPQAKILLTSASHKFGITGVSHLAQLAYLFLILLFSLLGVEPRALWILGKCSTTKLHPSQTLVFIHIIYCLYSKDFI
jgi:hypothetical protein